MSDKFSTQVTDENPRHTTIRVFNRGGLAGTLTVLTEDVEELAERINDKPFWIHDVRGRRSE